MVDSEGKEVEELQMIIQKCFTKRDRLEMLLKQMRGLKQGMQDADEFLLKFKNLQVLAKVSKDHTLEILQQNMQWGLIEKAILLHGPLTSYDHLRDVLLTIRMAELYLLMIKTNTYMACPPTRSNMTSLVPSLHLGTPMDVDRKKQSGMSTRLQVVA